MIYTVTFNPSLDYIVSVKDFQLGMSWLFLWIQKTIYKGGCLC